MMQLEDISAGQFGILHRETGLTRHGESLYNIIWKLSQRLFSKREKSSIEESKIRF